MNDLISRRAAIKAIDDLPNCYNGYSDTYDKAYIIGVLEEVPTIDPVKHGRWIEIKDDVFASTYRCSECGCWPLTEYDRLALTDYCPNCGALMERSEASLCDNCDEQKRGKWVEHIMDYWCSECGGRVQKEQAKMYSKCPNCGARMDGDI